MPAPSSSRLPSRSRWLLLVLCWGTIGLASLWAMREEFDLWRTYFTWAAVRYAIFFNRWPVFGLSLCLGLTVTTLIDYGRHYFCGQQPDRPRKP
ncbi:MAG: hypothetical protein ACAF42_08015 [Limnothrix sp. BL-A-16]